MSFFEGDFGRNFAVNRMRMKKLSRKKWEKQRLAGVSKVFALQEWEEKRLLLVDGEGHRTTVHYLIWHLWSGKGVVKLCQALYFFMMVKRTYDGRPEDKEAFLTVWVDYGVEPNDYERQEMVKMVMFHPEKGFKKT